MTPESGTWKWAVGLSIHPPQSESRLDDANKREDIWLRQGLVIWSLSTSRMLAEESDLSIYQGLLQELRTLPRPRDKTSSISMGRRRDVVLWRSERWIANQLKYQTSLKARAVSPPYLSIFPTNKQLSNT